MIYEIDVKIGAISRVWTEKSDEKKIKARVRKLLDVGVWVSNSKPGEKKIAVFYPGSRISEIIVTEK